MYANTVGGGNLIGMERLCDALADPKRAGGLQKLCLSGNNLPSQAGVMLVKGLEGCPSLKELECAAPERR